MSRRLTAVTVAAMALVLGGVGSAIVATDASARTVRALAVKPFAGIGGFTPALADPRLASIVGQAPSGGRDYDFTPAQARRLVASARVVASVRVNPVSVPGTAQIGPSVDVAPIDYNLGVSTGWKKFAPMGQGTRVESSIGVRTNFDLATTASASRLRPMVEKSVAAALPPGKEPERPLLDSTNAFRLTRHVDLTAGTRVKSESYRLDRLGDDRRDNQAVYVGTALRF